MSFTMGFADVRDAKVLGASWRDGFDHPRPHSWLGHVPLAKFTASLAVSSLGGAKVR
ncbi:MAG: hypothetical protein SGJ09_13645 [Phycisphaerae bacterium]|nr:hypothetical protein [Phycisphaerae bacterium]